MTAAAGKLLRGIRLFDIYRGVGVPEGKKSMAFSLELRADDRTLTDADSEKVVTNVLTALKEKLGASLR
jgi:phenylalanyl-tRNA synthetase beta chain